MNRFLFLFAALAISQPVLAQTPSPPLPPVSLPSELVNRIYGFLATGGTYAEAAGLRDAMLQAAQAPQREIEVQRRINDAVAKERAKAAKPDSQ